VTAFAIFALTTAGPVQIQRISRERAPLSMMVLGRGSERLAVSDRYDDFVYPGGGPVEKFLGPFPEGGFRLEVSAPIDSGDSWQLAAFMAHAVVAAGSHSLCRDVEEAEAILCLTGTVDFDGLIGGVGHIAEKMQAARDDLTRWRQGDVAPVFIVPSGDDHDRLLANDPGSGLAIQGAETVSELCAVLDIPLAPVSSPIEVEKPRPSPEKTARGGKWAWPVVAVVVAAGAYAVFGQLDPQPTLIMPESSPVQEPAPKSAALSPPAAADTTTTKPKPAKITQVATPKSMPKTVSKTVSKTAPKDVNIEPRKPRLSILERHAPLGHACAEVYFGAVRPMLRPVPLAGQNLFKTSRGPTLCGFVVRIELGQKEVYAVAGLETLAGRLVGTLRPPPDLSGRRAVKGRHDWTLDLPHHVKTPVSYRMSLTTSSTVMRRGLAPTGGKTISLQHDIRR
jgi:hypothetical protein